MHRACLASTIAFSAILVLAGCTRREESAANGRAVSPGRPAPNQPQAIAKAGVPAQKSSPGNPVGKPSPQPANAVGKWVPVQKDPVDLARRMDAMIGGLKGVKSEAVMLAELHNGKAQMRVEAKIKDPKTFEIQFPALLRSFPTTAIARADGKRVGVLIEGKAVNPGENGGPKTAEELGWSLRLSSHQQQSPTAVPADPIGVHRMVMGSLIDGGPALTRFMSALRKEGYAITTQQRDTKTPAGMVRNYRIIADRKGPQAKRFEIVLDANLYLPVTLNADFFVAGKRNYLRWRSRWLPKQTFNEADFKLPPTTR